MERREIESLLPGEIRSRIDAVAAEVAAAGPAALAERLPTLPRLFGAEPIAAEPTPFGVELGDALPARVDLGAWRLCDYAALRILEAADPDEEQIAALFDHGDLDERTSLLRALSLRPVDGAAARLLWEAQRSNVETHFRAAVLDTNLPARAWDHPGFGEDGFDRMILKAAFLGLDPDRILDLDRRANPELSRMLLGLATEREAAGRAVWVGTHRMLGLAPCPGARARLVGGLEHGDDRHRLAAVIGLEALVRAGDDTLLPFVRERIERENVAEIRARLTALAGGGEPR